MRWMIAGILALLLGTLLYFNMIFCTCDEPPPEEPELQYQQAHYTTQENCDVCHQELHASEDL